MWGKPKNLNFSPSVPTLLAQAWDSLAWFVWMQGLHWPLAEAQLEHCLKSSVGEAVLSAWLFKALFLSPEPDSRESQRLDLLPLFQCLVCFLFQSVISATYVPLTRRETRQLAACRMNWRLSQGGVGTTDGAKGAEAPNSRFQPLWALCLKHYTTLFKADKLQNEHSSNDKV